MEMNFMQLSVYTPVPVLLIIRASSRMGVVEFGAWPDSSSDLGIYLL